jgi:hypothetical protein
MRLGTLLALAIVLSTAGGCAGLGVLAVGNDQTIIVNPRLSSEKSEGFLYSERGKIYSTGGVTPATTADQLRKAWGAAEHIEKVGPQREVWRYNHGLRWNGLVFLVVVVPVPVIFPVGSDTTEFTIEGGWITRVIVREDTATAAVGCAAAFGLHAGSGADCWFGSIPREDRWLRLTDGEPGVGYWQYRISNGTRRRVSLVFTDNAGQTQSLDLDNLETATIKSGNFGRSFAATSEPGIIGHQIDFATDYPQADRSFAYVVTDQGFVALPQYYRDKWETYPPIGDPHRRLK